MGCSAPDNCGLQATSDFHVSRVAYVGAGDIAGDNRNSRKPMTRGARRFYKRSHP